MRDGERKKHPEHQLTPLSVKRLGPGRHSDGGGLYVLVDDSSRRWVFRYQQDGRRRDKGLGSTRDVTLSEAREKARNLRKVARDGGDPFAVRESPEFEKAAREFFEGRKSSWKNEKHKKQVLATLEAYAFPSIGRMRVDTIGPDEVLSVLEPIWTAKPETARRVRQRIGIVLDWSKVRGWRTTPSPTRELGTALAKQSDAPKHHTALPYTDVPGFIRDMHATGAMDATKGALEWLILSATRTNETLGARLSEVNAKAATWTIPGERMKSGKPHVVPLSARALEILDARNAAHSGKGEFLFEHSPGKPLSNMAMLTLMKRMEVGAVPHGFRSSFRDWAAEKTNAPREVAEACLAHIVESKAERAYKRTDFLAKRKKLMDDWATWCAGGAKVIKLAERGR
ncbi:MAG: tyrosine-type recombinase/integrase [Alphaproteobacteria bacterium]|nr:tyrosine-type recombinase/integrase [Alphaproteobacteria bacterium]